MNISYSLTNVEILDFQLPETKPQGGNLQVNCSFTFGIVPDAGGQPQSIQCTGNFVYQAGMFVALSAEIRETFSVDSFGWTMMRDGKSITLPKDFQKQLAATLADTARGVIAARTEGSWLQPYFLPMIDPSAMIKEDLRFEAQVLDA